MKRYLQLFVFAVGSLLHFAVSAATVWDESINGELSGDPLAPTAVIFSPGSNTIIGSVSSDHDFLTFSIGAGFALTAIEVVSWVDGVGGGDGNTGYGLIDDGASSVIPSVATSGDFLGGSHLDASLVGGNLLLGLAASTPVTTGGTGFTAPLGPGTYTWLTRQGGIDLVDYEIEFVVSAVPLPATIWMMGAGLLGLVAKRRRMTH